MKRCVRVRPIAAAHADFGGRLTSGQFRNDLLQRVAGAVIHLPPLKERGNDVEILAIHFAVRRGKDLSPSALELLQRHSWPGNVRELRLVVERAVCLSPSRIISSDTMAASLRMGASIFSSQQPSAVAEEMPAKDRVMAVCAENDWNASRTAKALGLGRTTLFKELKSLGISLRDSRSRAELRVRRIGDDESRDRFERNGWT